VAQTATDTVSVTWTPVTAGGAQSASDTMAVTWNAPVAGGTQTASDLVTVTWTAAAWSAYRWDTTTRALVPVALGRWVSGSFVWLTDPPADLATGGTFSAPFPSSF
jgi:hypothetical protein